MIVNSNVNQSNLMMVGTGTTSAETNTTNKNVGNDGVNFADVLAFKQDANVTGSKSDAVQQTPDKAPKGKTDQVKDGTAASDTRQTEQTEVTGQMKQNPTDDKQETVTEISEVSDDIVSGEQIQDVTDAISQLLAMIMNQLQISLDDVQQNLQISGMDVQDLFTTDGIKTFFLQVQEADTTDLLTNADLNQQLQDFVNDWNQLLEGMDLSPEDLIAIADKTGMEDVFQNLVSEILPDMDNTMENVGQTATMKDRQVEDIEEPEVIVENQNSKQIMPEKATATPKKQMEQNSDTQDTASMPEYETPQPKHNTDSEFVNPILQNIQEALDHVESLKPQENVVEPKQIVEQVVEQVKVHMSQENTSIQLQLYPEHLGRIQIHVVSKDGVMTARIAAETEQAKQAIENGLASLKETFDQQDLKVDAVEVMVSTTGFERGNEEHNAQEQEKTGHRSGKLSLAGLEEEVEENDMAEQERMRASGSSVSYSA